MSNPLLGKHIALISKKNIRYEGVLYSINEQNSTVALQNVRTFGTEGREKTEEGCVFVAPTDTMHPYLLFRGQDIKDLHVHESSADEGGAADAAAPESTAPATTAAETTTTTTTATAAATGKQTRESGTTSTAGEDGTENNNNNKPTTTKSFSQAAAAAAASKQPHAGGRGKQQHPHHHRPRNPNNKVPAVGTGASLLKRSVRGASGSKLPEPPQGDFDFQSKLEQFQKEEEEEHQDEDDEDEAGDSTPHPAYNAKDDFFDSISCDALDKQMGKDNRLRGSTERQLNTETFGATALNQQRRRRGRGYHGGRGGGRGGGGNGRGRGRGRGRGGRGRGYYHQRGGGGSGRAAPAAVESS